MIDSSNWRGDASDNEDYEYEMKGCALPIAPFDINCVDETATPLTSQEYLQQVIAQRAKLPEIVTAVVPQLPRGIGESSVAAFFPDEEVIPSVHRPSDKWQQQQISSFSDLRYRIEVNREQWNCNNLNKFPRKKDDLFQFLFHEHPYANDVSKHQPYLSTVLSMRNETVERLIQFIVEFVIEDKISVYQSGTWLFALLVCIEAPVCASLIKKLRALVRKCREVREKMDFSIEENAKELSAQNLFICLICKYFGQHDLSD